MAGLTQSCGCWDCKSHRGPALLNSPPTFSEWERKAVAALEGQKPRWSVTKWGQAGTGAQVTLLSTNVKLLERRQLELTHHYIIPSVPNGSQPKAGSQKMFHGILTRATTWRNPRNMLRERNQSLRTI